MPFGDPKHVAPWTRKNWSNLNRGQMLYAIQEYQAYKARRGEPIPQLTPRVARYIKRPVDWISKKALNIFSSLFPGEEIGIEVAQDAGGSPTDEAAVSPQPPEGHQTPSRTTNEENGGFKGFSQEETTRDIITNLHLYSATDDLCLHYCDKKVHIVIHNG